MSFCNACGTAITPGTRFCSNCGAPILASSLPGSSTSAGPIPSQPVPPTTATYPTAPAAQGGSAMKTILVIAGVVMLFGIIGISSLAFFAWRVARHSHVHQDGDNVKVETPFGTVETTKDPEDAARNLGVEIYPGAEIRKDGASFATIGGVHTATLTAETSVSVDKVASFYKAKFPNALVTSSDPGRCSIVSNDQKGMVTINIEAEGDKTKIMISNVTHKSGENTSPK